MSNPLNQPLWPSIPGYVLTEELYVGGCTAVYRALADADIQAPPVAHPVVIKVLKSPHPSFKALVSFRNQYIIAKNLSIEGIVRPLALVPWAHSYALVMEDVGGIALSEYLQRCRPLSLREVLEIALQMADILHHLSQHRVLHKDINPANILIHPDTHKIWLTDFSLASLLPKESQDLQSHRALEGTLAYIAPEQTGRMNRGIDYRADFYGLGVTLYELLTGELPFQGDDPMALIHNHIAKAPISPCEFSPSPHLAIPPSLSDIVLKLMAKNAEDRYQSALGLKHDLQTCLDQWTETGTIVEFELGQRDVCDRFLIPEKLYGREAEVQTLLDAFERVAQGSSELMLVAGFSGIGKTVVVNEIHKPITEKKGYFIKGKFDQFNRNIPFSAFVQAFRSLMGQLLGESDVALAVWKAKILAAVGESGQVLIEVIPELAHIIGKQPDVLELSGGAARNRFNLLFGKFIRVFTTADHPLVIFLDDLQWVDPASLNLFNLLMADESGYLLVLGAYRDHEVLPTHPLMLSLDALRQQGATLNILTLDPLTEDDINHLVSDSLHCSVEISLPLSKLVSQKTHGNPFFATQFLQELAGDGWITFNANQGYWQCDLAQVRQLALTDDVVVFMVGRIQKLPEATQHVLKIAACMGNQFDLSTLAVVCEQSQEEVATSLWQSLQVGLVIPENETYKFFQEVSQDIRALHTATVEYRFLHDRVQQSAYFLIPESQKQTTHYRIGQMLLEKIPSEAREERIFELLGQLNHGKDLIVSQAERTQLAQLNLIACRRAKASAAYNAALAYCNIALNYVGIESWQNQYPLARDLHLLGIELEYLNSNFERSRERAEYALRYTQNVLDDVEICQLKVQSYIVQSQMLAAIETGMKGLALLGCPLLDVPDIEVATLEIPDLESVEKLKKLDDFKERVKIKFLASLITPVYVGKPDLLPKLIFVIVQSSMDYGYSSISAVGYGWYALLLLISGYIDKAYQAGQVSLRLLERFPDNENECKVLFVFYNFISSLKNHMNVSLEGLLQGARSGFDSGDVEYAAYCEMAYGAFLFSMGHNLMETKELQQPHYDFIKKLDLEFSTNFLRIWRQSGLNLLGESERNSLLVGDSFNEAAQLPIFQETNSFTLLFSLHLNKAILLYLFGGYSASLKQCHLALNYASAEQGVTHLSLQKLYYSLSLLANYPNASDEINVLGIVESNQQKLKIWATYAPMNFQHKYDLVEAEKCRVLGQKSEAIELYDQAIAGAKENDYLQEEALGNELAAKFYLDWGKARVAAGYMQEAYYCYARWGAKAKTDDLEQQYSELLKPILQEEKDSASLKALENIATPNFSIHSASSSSVNSNEQLDLIAVLKAAQLLSETIQIDELLGQLAQLMLQSSGADKLAVILPESGGSWQVRAIATPEKNQLLTEPLIESSSLPIQLIRYVKNTQEIIAIDDLDPGFQIVDTYLREYQPCSILCLPILHQGNLRGLLYLQNQSIAGVFTRDRITVINFLCTQAAIALENAQLYQTLEQRVEERTQALQASQEELEHLNRELEERVRDRTAQLAASEGRLKKLFDQAADATFLLGEQGFIDCNQAAVNLFGYSSKTDMLGLHPHQISPERQPDGQLSVDKFQSLIKEALQRCSLRFEWVHQRANGENFWTEITLTPIKYRGEILFHGVKRDISDRKAAEEKLLESQTFLNTILDTFPLAVFWKDRESRYISANQNFVQDAGFDNAEDIAGLTDFDMPWSEAEARAFRADDQAVMLSDTPKLGLLQTQLNAEGTLAWLETNKLPLHDLDGNVIGVLSTYQDISDRKQLEKEQNRLTQILQSTSDFVGLCQPEKGILWQNRPFRNLRPDLRIAEEAVPISKLYPEWAFEIVQQEGLPAAIEHGIWSGETALLGPSGEEIPTSQVIIAHKSDTGEIEYFSTILRDMSDRKRTEAALQLSEARATAVFTQATVGIVEANLLSGKLIQFNDYFCELLGYSRAELQNMCLQDVTHPDDLLECKQLIRALDTGKISNFALERRFVHKNGSTVWILASANKVQLPNGQPHTGVAILQDINDRKAAELALQDAQTQFRRMTENVPGMIYRWVLHADGTREFLYVSSKVREFFEIEPDAILQNETLIWERIHPHDVPRVQHDIAVNGESLQAFKSEFRLILPQKGLRWVQISSQPEQLDNGDIIWDGVLMDMSDRKRAEAQLQRTNKELVRATRMKDEFLANMSHELRTPLNAILGMTEGLQDEVFGEINEQQLKSLTTIEQSGSHLLELINEVLDLAKIESGSIELEYSLVSVTHLCQSSLTFIRQQSLEKGIQLHLATPWDLPAIRVDERRLRQVLINLLNNAVKFTPSGGNVTLKVALLPPDENHDQHTLSFAVSDTGIGIAHNQLKRLFQPFVQIDSALNRQYEGTGLGLALVKRIVELHGGHVTVTSEVGVGSCFTIELPYNTAMQQGASSSTAMSAPSATLSEMEP